MKGAHLRTLIVAAGLGFTAAAIGGACLDYAGEDWGACQPTGGASSSSGTVIGSGSGNGAAKLGGTGGPSSPGLSPATAPTVDCGTGMVLVGSEAGAQPAP